MNLNLYLLEQPPFQNFDPSNVYLRSYNKDDFFRKVRLLFN